MMQRLKCQSIKRGKNAHYTLKIIMAVISLIGIGAIYYSTIEPDWFRELLAILFASVTGIAIFFVPFKFGGSIWAAAIIILLIWYINDPAKNNRDWAPEYAIPTKVSINGQTITIQNIRNFSYRSETEAIPAYYNATFQLDQLETVELVSSYWSGNAIAHNLLTFGFHDGRHIAISIETRRQRRFSYSTIAGFFHYYELFYVVADERDLIGIRTDIRHERVYLYRLHGTLSTKDALLLSYLHKIQKLEAHPEWYNTITDNCTTGILARGRGDSNVPLNWRILLSGYAAEYAYRINLLNHSMSFPELQKKA